MLEFDVPAVESVRGIPRSEGGRHVLFVTMPDGDPFDLIGPMAVLREANFFFAASGRPDLSYTFEVVCSVPGTLLEADGFRMQVDRPCYDVTGPVDTVVFQAIDLEGKCLLDEAFIDWVREIAGNTRRMASACLGSYVLAEAGLLDGRRAASHWSVSRHFRERYPEVEFDGDPIYIKDGKFYTSAGMTSIIDLMMALVEEDFGSELALRVAQGMVMFLRRPANQSQFSTHLVELQTEDRRLRDVVAHVAQHPDEDLRVGRLAKLAAMSPRNFARVFTQELGITPGKFVELSRLEAARRWLEQTSTSVERIARACGYGTAAGMRLAFDRTLGVTPREYRNRFS